MKEEKVVCVAFEPCMSNAEELINIATMERIGNQLTRKGGFFESPRLDAVLRMEKEVEDWLKESEKVEEDIREDHRVCGTRGLPGSEEGVASAVPQLEG